MKLEDRSRKVWMNGPACRETVDAVRLETLAVLCFSVERTGAVLDVDTILDGAADDRTAEIFSNLKFFWRDGQTVKTNLLGDGAAVFAQSEGDRSAGRSFNDSTKDDGTIITI